MVTVAIVVAIVVVASITATIINRRGPDVPTSPSFGVPQQLDRQDFAAPETQWLFALFTSKTCLSCADARLALAPIDSPAVHVQELDVESTKALHDRYGIDAVPTVVLADSSGVVQWSYLGAPPPQVLGDILIDIGVGPPELGGTAVDIG